MSVVAYSRVAQESSSNIILLLRLEHFLQKYKVHVLNNYEFQAGQISTSTFLFRVGL